MICRFLAALTLILIPGSALAQSTCPPPSSGLWTFGQDALGTLTPLAVNPDGADASYTVGDHGYTYINNGVRLLEGVTSTACSAAGMAVRCRAAWREAERGDFGPGTPEFCMFAMEAAPYRPGGTAQVCPGSTWEPVVGNGKGRPRIGGTLTSVSGGSVAFYRSTTSLRHTVGGQARALDSATIPVLVVPRSHRRLLGAVAWVEHEGRGTFAIVGDVGPRFGEASVALHRHIRGFVDDPPQPIGPIPLNLRCTAVETGLRPPFQSRPDAANDQCRAGYQPRSASDIRAYAGIQGDVKSIILTKVHPEMSGTTVLETVTPSRLRALAEAQGYSAARLAQMTRCLR